MVLILSFFYNSLMINKTTINTLKETFKTFYLFAPKQQSLIFILMLLQGMTAGVGLLFIIPLSQIVGFDLGKTMHHGVSDIANQFFHGVGIETNLINILISYVVIVSLIASLRYQLTLMTTRVQKSYIRFLRNRLYRLLLNTHWQFIMQNKMSDFTHSLTVQVQSIGYASHLMLTLLNQIVLTVVMTALTFLLSWEMTLLAMSFAVLLLLLLRPLNHLVYASGRTQLVSYKAIFQMLTEQLSSLKMIKSYASERQHADQVDQKSQLLEAQQLQLVRINALTQWVYTVGAVVSFSLFFYIALQLLAIPLATIFLLLVVYSRLLPQVSGLQKSYQQLLHKLPAFKDVNSMLQRCEDNQEAALYGNDDNDYPTLTRKIHLNKVQYHYPNKDQPIFESLSLTIEKNQTIALVGESGAGKSTLADIIAGLIEPTAGKFYCDDVLLEGEQRIKWRQKIAYVTQEVYLFHDSIRANLSWVTEKTVSDETLWQVLRHAAADGFVAKLPNGLDTLIGDQGVRLSGGERQRLALARALLSEPQLLILDEATSALDRKNERHLQQAIENFHGKLTILIISHRFSTLAKADRIVMLDEGKLHTFDDITAVKQFYSERSFQTINH